MFINRASWKRRVLIGCISFALFVPVLFALSDVAKARRIAQAGDHIQGEITALHPEPADRRAYSVFTYTYNAAEYQGTVGGVSGYRVGQKLPLTVQSDIPSNYWIGDASEDVSRLVIESLLGAAWLSLGAAFLFRWPGAGREL